MNGWPAVNSAVEVTFLTAHAKLHPAGAEIDALLTQGVRPSTVLALYPFALTDWCPRLQTRFEASPAACDAFVRWLTTGPTSNRWLDITSNLTPLTDQLVLNAATEFLATQQAAALEKVLTHEQHVYDTFLTGQALRYVAEILTAAACWPKVTELHRGDWTGEYEVVLGNVLRGLGFGTALGDEAEQAVEVVAPW